MLVIITKIICDECNRVEIGTSSYIEQRDMVILAAKEAGWTTRETNKRKHPQWICPNCQSAMRSIGKDEEESE